MKIFDTSDDVVEMIEEKFDDANFPNYGINLKCMSVTKAKDVIKVSKASATTEYLSKKDDMIIFTVYEDAFDRLPEEIKWMLIEGAMSLVVYDPEKDKTSVDNSPYSQVFNMRKKFGDTVFLNALELSYQVIAQIEQEEKEKKEAEKEAKRMAKANKG